MQSRRAEEKKDGPAWLSGPDRSQGREQRDLNRIKVNFPE
jgi:hypothetical protein